jgi:hypothetical protein
MAQFLSSELPILVRLRRPACPARCLESKVSCLHFDDWEENNANSRPAADGRAAVGFSGKGRLEEGEGG